MLFRYQRPPDLCTSCPNPDRPLLCALCFGACRIYTSSPEAQALFDQGLLLAYDFDQPAALVAFKEGLKADPHAPMLHWGVAYAAGGWCQIQCVPRGGECHILHVTYTTYETWQPVLLAASRAISCSWFPATQMRSKPSIDRLYANRRLDCCMTQQSLDMECQGTQPTHTAHCLLQVRS